MTALPRRLPGALRFALAVVAILALMEAGAWLSVGGVKRLPAFFADTPDHGYYSLAPGRYRYWHRSRRVTVTIGEDARRIVPAAPTEAEREIWLIGDSQVFGWGLDDAETVAARLQTYLGADYRIVNAGVPGYGPMTYVRVLETAPREADRIVFFTETNDGQDAFSSAPFGKPHCGILTVPGGVGAALPCRVMNSQLFSLIIDIRNAMAPQRLSPSLNCNPGLRSSSAIIRSRIDAVERRIAASRAASGATGGATGGAALTATIPWDARIAPRRLKIYLPTLDAADCAWDFPDAAGLVAAFAAAQDKDALFQKNDHHLSAAGADFVAKHLARAVRNGSAGAGAAENGGHPAEQEERRAQQQADDMLANDLGP